MNRKKIFTALLVILFAACSTAAVATPVFAATSSTPDMTTTIMQFMPLIVTFAMLGMVLGLLKKFGKF
ncbi:hypothetical protein MUP79_09445 [Candidatus Bathyarchaeota archaeon]|nr:hypothetical protein [Candidatus Bathyarchaeota archaeon]